MNHPVIEQILNPLRSHAGFTMATIVTLGASWGVCLAVVVLLQSSFLRAPPFADLEELIWVRGSVGTGQGINPGLIDELRDEFAEVGDFGGYTRIEMNRPIEVGPDRSLPIRISLATVNLFEILRIDASHGRLFVPEDDLPGGVTPMVISHRLWREAFGADESVLGGIYPLDGRPARLVGVLPPGFEGLSNAELFEAYIPHGHYRHLMWEVFYTNLNYRTMAGIARIPEPHDRNVLQSRLEAYWVGYLSRNPEAHPFTPNTYNWRANMFNRRGDLLQLLRLYGAVVGALFFIAIANAIILILLRTAWRASEILTKISLGAARSHLLRDFAIEGALICVLALGVAASVCWGLLWAAATFLPDVVPSYGLHTWGTPMWVFLVVTFALQCLLFTAVPTMWIRGMNPADITREGRGTTRRIRALPVLAVVQVAVTTILVVISVHFVLSSHRIANFDPGYRTDGIVTFTYGLRHLNLESEERGAVNRSIESAVEGLPEVEAVARGWLGYLGQPATGDVYFEEDLAEGGILPVNNVYRIRAGPGFLALIGIPVLKGRDFDFADGESNELVAMVTQSFADQYYPGEDPVGKRFRILGQDRPFTTIVGVAADFHTFPFDDQPPVIIHYAWGGMVVAKVLGSMDSARRSVDRMLADQFGHVGIPPVSSVEDLIYENTKDTHVAARIVTMIAGLAVLLSLFGLYVVFSFSTTLLRRDYAIRMALGATTRQIAGFAGVRFAAICVLGLVIGVVATILISPYVGVVLGKEMPNEPIGYALALLLVALFGATVSVTSALRTRRIDPATELME